MLLGKVELVHSSQPASEGGRRAPFFTKEETEARRDSETERHQLQVTSPRAPRQLVAGLRFKCDSASFLALPCLTPSTARGQRPARSRTVSLKPGDAKVVPRVSVGLGHSLLWPFPWSWIKHLVNAVSRPVPRLSYLLTKCCLLNRSPLVIGLAHLSSCRSWSFSMGTRHTFLLFLQHFFLRPTSGPLHILCVCNSPPPMNSFCPSDPHSNAS